MWLGIVNCYSFIHIDGITIFFVDMIKKILIDIIILYYYLWSWEVYLSNIWCILND